MNKQIAISALCLAVKAVKVQVEDVFSDIGDWFSNDFVDFWEDDFVDFWEDDFVNFWEDDFVNFWEGAYEDTEDWIFGDNDDPASCVANATDHKRNEALPGRGITTTYQRIEYDFRRKE